MSKETGSSNASCAAMGPVAHVAPVAEPSAAYDYEVVNRFDVTISTAGDEQLARATALRLSRQFTGLRVERVERIESRLVIYRPRGVAP